MITRRNLIKVAGFGTLAVAGTGALPPAPASARQDMDRISFGSGAPKPVPSLGALDPASQSAVESLFWTEIMAEHGILLASLLSAAELRPLRQQAVDFAE